MRKQLFWLISFLLFINFSVKSQNFQVFTICENNGDVSLSWEVVDTCDGFNSFILYKRVSQGDSFQAIDTIRNFSTRFTYTPNDLNKLRDWSYYLKGYRDCPNDSFTFSDTIGVDKTKPGPVELDSVSVENGNIVLGWSPSSEKDVQGYNIYYVNNGQTRKIDEVEGANNTFYVDSLVGNPENSTEKYRIGAFDSCDNASPISIQTHKTILANYTQDSCSGEVQLNWDNYGGWKVDSFKIFIGPGDSNSGYRPIKTVDGDSLKTTLTSLETGKSFRALVMGVEEGGNATSSSNMIRFENIGTSDPGFTYIKKGSVVDSQINLEWELNEAVAIDRFKIYRGEELEDLSVIAEVPYSGGKSFRYVDSQSNPSENDYFYQIEVLGVCGNIVDESNFIKTVFLEVDNPDNGQDLIWEPYRGYDGGIDNYVVQRLERRDDNQGWQTIGESAGNFNEFFDEKTYDSFPQNGVCYRVRAIEGPNNAYGFQEKSYSNVSCVFGDPIVYVPNAFIPKGENNRFRPVGKFIDYGASSMVIFNRWGEQIFQTDNNVEKGWDGSRDNKSGLAPAGTYMYKIKIVGENQNIQNLSGDVTLIR